MKAAIYARVSTDDQHTGNQVAELEAWAAAQGLEVVAVYAEKESAWAAGHQVELQRLLADADRRRFAVVLVWALDRLTREGALSILRLVDRLKYAGCRLYSFKEPWTMAPGKAGDILFSIVGWVAQMESARRSDRTKAGMKRAEKYGTKSGKAIGRPIGKKDKKPRKPRQPRLMPARLGAQRGF
jgi:putative DNA-invertase from lambdoid prophage Rac